MRNLIDRLRARSLPEEAEMAFDEEARDIPIFWLLGRTGAGKSSLIRVLTGLDEIEVGNGYASCTHTSKKFDFPAEQPLVRFLDTRDLGEAGYDPDEDLAACEGHSHAIIVVARLDDPVQGEVSDALAEVLRRRPDIEVLRVHTGVDLVADKATIDRAASTTSARFSAAARRDIPEVMIGLPPKAQPAPEDMAALVLC
jgi:predicted GTPase